MYCRWYFTADQSQIAVDWSYITLSRLPSIGLSTFRVSKPTLVCIFWYIGPTFALAAACNLLTADTTRSKMVMLARVSVLLHVASISCVFLSPSSLVISCCVLWSMMISSACSCCFDCVEPNVNSSFFSWHYFSFS